ncbi:MAG TPA: SdrD B-like domain-containing protein, partial [Ignavibacteriaceae bacterium]|nr:SdrD B-like domain-containing protein [Ignavibacteriaceae bacterium]
IAPPQILTGSIGDYVWIDANENGIQTSGELPFHNVKVYLLNGNDDSLLDSTSTDSKGNYLFNSLAFGTYKIKFLAPDGYVISEKQTGGSSSYLGDSNPDSLTGITDTIQIVSGNLNRYDIDAGMHIYTAPPPLTGSVGDYVWNDSNKNGLQEAGELPLLGVQVKLLDADNIDAVLNTTTTNSSGNYSFNNVVAGNYKVQFVTPTNYFISLKDANNNQSDEGDSDPDPTSGKTDAFVVSAGENIYSVDAGMSENQNQQQLGSMGDFVFDDTNHDGLQDSSEKGIPNVTVKLLDSNKNVLQTTTTDQNGNYIFTNLASGDYRLQFSALPGYVFSPADVSEANNGAYDSEADSTGLTKVLWLNDGENNMTYDAGMYEPVVVEKFPKLFVGIDDGTTTAPDSGKTTVYTISYRNDGSTDLLNAVITDTLPSGMSYVKTSNSVSPTVSGNVITVQLGTLGVLASGSFTVEAMTMGMESEYLNKVLLAGVDSKNKNYSESAKDLNYGASTSGGGGSGLESRGDLAEALLRRQLRIQTGTTIPVIAKSSVSGLSAQETLDQLVPAVGPYSSTAIVSTPYDILGVSNAVSSYAVDYDLTNSGITRRVAGIFATITQAPDIYDHTKAICDRLEGAEVKEIKLIDINGYKFYAAKVLKADKKIVDYAISFSVYETASGDFIESKWTHDEYHAPNGATSVYNFQIWSSSYENSVQLTEQILAKIKSLNPVTYMNTNQLVPDTYISTVQYTHDGNIHLTIVNNDAAKNVSLNTMYRLSQGSNQVSRTDNFSLNTGTNNLVINSGVIADANIYLDQVNDFKDEAFVSGGAYTYITGSATTVSSFNTANFPQADISKYPKDALLLSGGADVAGSLKDYVNVVRSLKSNGSAEDLSNYSSIRFEASGSGELDVLLIMINTKDNNYYHYSVNLNSTDKEYVINFSDFKELYGSQTAFDASKICDVAFSMNVNANVGMDNFNFELKYIGFYTPGSVTAVDNVNNIPKEFSLALNYPNPFNPSTTIQFNVAKQEHITLVIYNLLGQEVKKLVDGEMNVGKHSITFNANNLASGIYFYKLIGNSVNITRKMILMK